MTNVLNLNGELLSVRDLNERVAEGYDVENGIVGTSNGAFMYYDSLEMETEESNSDNGEIQEYIKVDYKTLYEEFIQEIDEAFQEVVSFKVDKNDECLNGVVRSTCNNTIYFYNIFRDNETGEIINNVVSMNKSMLTGLFVA